MTPQQKQPLNAENQLGMILGELEGLVQQLTADGYQPDAITVGLFEMLINLNSTQAE